MVTLLISMIMTDVGFDVCSGTSRDVANIDDDDDGR